MSDQISFPEWLNANSLRSYPISSRGSGSSSSGGVQLPKSLVVDFLVNIPFSRATHSPFISRFESLPDRITITITSNHQVILKHMKPPKLISMWSHKIIEAFLAISCISYVSNLTLNSMLMGTFTKKTILTRHTLPHCV